MSLKKYNIAYQTDLSIAENCEKLMKGNNINKTFNHVSEVAKVGVELAERFNVDIKKIETACLLHDICVIVPREDWLNLCREYNLEILPEEENLTVLIHQKVSEIIVREIFNITDSEILSAVRYHTTLKAKPSIIDMIVFIADKLAWDQDGTQITPPFFEIVESALESSLEAACLAYTDYMIDNNMFSILHPEAASAKKYLETKISS